MLCLEIWIGRSRRRRRRLVESVETLMSNRPVMFELLITNIFRV